MSTSAPSAEHAPTAEARRHGGRREAIAPDRVSPHRFVVAARPGPAPARRESINAAAARFGMGPGALASLLDAAGVDRCHPGGVEVSAVAAAVEARQRAAADDRAHVPDAEGAVACGACWSIAAITNGRQTRCRWCSPTGGWSD